MDAQRINNLILNIQDEVKALKALLDPSVEAQWHRSRRPDAGPSVSRPKGTHSDPTGDIVVDPKRLALRRAVRRSEDALVDALFRLKASRAALAKALSRWEGEEAV